MGGRSVNLSLVSSTVASLLNPCQCGDAWNCCCKSYTASETASTSESASTQSLLSNGKNDAYPITTQASDGLDALARAAALFSSAVGSCSPAPYSQQIEPVSFPDAGERASPTPVLPPAKRPCSPVPTSTPVLDLPPLLFPDISRPATVVPPFSTFTTLAGSGCTCGLTCQCPDCHSNAKSSTGGDCMNCVDPSLRVIDRSSNYNFPIKSTVLENFFAVAERVPRPPVVGGKPVEIPKLCCAGSCGCAGACGCGGDCNGCCQDLGKDAPEKDSVALAMALAPPARSCCTTP